MTVRLTSSVLVSAMIRQMQATGGHAMVLAKGDATAGAILIALADRGQTTSLIERVLGADGYRLTPVGPGNAAEITDYLARRRNRDPDLWVVELDGPDAATVAQAVIG